VILGVYPVVDKLCLCNKEEVEVGIEKSMVHFLCLGREAVDIDVFYPKA
jgi:hypothetical protein